MAVRTLTLLPTYVLQTGGTSWSNTERIRNRDGSPAGILLSAGASSPTLQLLYIGSPELAALPASMSVPVLGISISIWRCSYTAGAIKDLTVKQASGNGTPSGSSYADTVNAWPQSSSSPGQIVFTEKSYPITSGLPTLAQLRTNDYGVLIQCQNTSGSSANAYIDAVTVTVTVDWPDEISAPTSNPATSGAVDDPGLIDVSATADLLQAQAAARGIAVSDQITTFEMSYWDREAAALDMVYATGQWISGGYRSGPTDDPADTAFRPAIIEWEVTQSLLGAQQIVSGSLPYEARVVLVNPDGRYDVLLPSRAYVADFPVTMKNGLAGTKYADLALLFEGAVQTVTHAIRAGTVTILTKGNLRLLNASLAAIRDTGANNSAMQDVALPIAIGDCRNVRPPLVHVANATYCLHGDGSMGGASAVRVGGAADATGTVDTIAGTLDFSSARSGEVTADVTGAKPRNAVKNCRRMTQTGWSTTNLTVSDYSPGLDGSGICTLVEVTGAGAKATMTLLESIAGYRSGCWSALIQKVQGSGQFQIAGGTTVTIGSAVARPYRTITSPNGTGTQLEWSFPGGAGDKFLIDYCMVEPGAVKPSWPIDSTTLVATKYPNTIAEILKWTLTARCGVLPFGHGFDMTQIDRLAAQAGAAMGLYLNEDRSVLQVAQVLLDSALAWLTIGRGGLISAGRIGFAEDTQVAVLTERRQIIDAQIVPRTLPRAVRVLFRPNAHLQTASGDNAEVSGREFEERYGENPDLALATGSSAEQIMEVVTALSAGADAAELVDRLLALFGPDTMLVELTCTMAAVNVWQGDTIVWSFSSLTHERDAAPRGRRGLVLSRKLSEPAAQVELLVLS